MVARRSSLGFKGLFHKHHGGSRGTENVKWVRVAVSVDYTVGALIWVGLGHANYSLVAQGLGTEFLIWRFQSG